MNPQGLKRSRDYQERSDLTSHADASGRGRCRCARGARTLACRVDTRVYARATPHNPRGGNMLNQTFCNFQVPLRNTSIPIIAIRDCAIAIAVKIPLDASLV